MKRIERTISIRVLGVELEIAARLWLSFIDDPTTDLWGGAGPDCRIMPVRAGANP